LAGIVLSERPWCQRYVEVEAQENINLWRNLTLEEKPCGNWDAIPLDVAQGMAFEGELVAVDQIRERLDQIERPALLRPRAGGVLSYAELAAGGVRGARGKCRLCRIGAPAGWLGESGSGLPQSKRVEER
jgi:hypothetical protein